MFKKYILFVLLSLVTVQSYAERRTIPNNISECASSACKQEFLPYAQLARNAYNKDSVPTGWEYVNYVNNSAYDNGLYAKAYINHNKREFVIAYRGTELNSIEDIGTDLHAILGRNSIPEQYWDGVVLAFNTMIDFHNQNVDYKIVLVGHSLGGGITQFSAGALGLKAYAFNALPMNDYMYGLMFAIKDYIKTSVPMLYNPQSNINHLISKGNMFYDTVSSLKGKIYGSQIKYIKIYVGLKHGLPSVIKYLQRTSNSALDNVIDFFTGWW